MLNLENIKWCAIQPLTGGMYFGAENAIGHPAEFILSYPGLGEPKYNKKTKEFVSCGNEYHLLKYLKEHNRQPEYKVFNRTTFQCDDNIDVEILNTDWTLNPDKDLDYSDMDVCVAVPVCSGMSNATNSSTETRDKRNCNMTWISKYAIEVIKPKIYIFENAPTFMGTRGDRVRIYLEDLANKNDYSLIYYKTDTKFHDNCQSRKRTFIIFLKKDFAPKMDFEKIEVTNKEYFDRIPEKYRMKTSDLNFVNVNGLNEVIVGYLKNKFGNNWRTVTNNRVYDFITIENLWDDVKEYTNSVDYLSEDRRKGTLKFLNHLTNNLAEGRGVYHAFPFLTVPDGTTPAVMFKMIQGCLHFSEDRLLNSRELLHLMGMPHDFNLCGEACKMYAQIGQNVPARTAYWIISEAIRAYNRENDLTENKKIRYFNNAIQRELIYKK